MDPKEFGRAILRRKASVITAVVVALAFSLYGSARKQPVFSSTCQLLFQATAQDLTENDTRPYNPIGSQKDHAELIKSTALAAPTAKLLKLPIEELGGIAIDVAFDNTGNLFTITVADSGGPVSGMSAQKYASQAPGMRAADVCNARMQAYRNFNLDEARKGYQKQLRRKQNLLNELYKEVAFWNEQIAAKGGPESAPLELIERNQALKSVTEVREVITGIKDTLREGITGGGKVLELAGPGPDLNSDKMKDLLMGLLMGLMFGIGFAVVREYFDDTVKDKESTQRELGVPVLAALPAEPDFEGFGEPSPATMEAARGLRATLGSLGVPNDKNVLLLTSSLAKRRSTTLVSLANAFAESGRSVLVLGSDLRGGRTHEAFGIANTVGLANVIRGQVPFEKAIRPAPGMDGVYVLPCGPVIGNPGELLSSEGMAMTLRRAQRWADVVLLDAPPVLAAADSSILGAFADGIVMVLSAGQTNKARAAEAKEQLVSAGGRVLGVVLTDCEDLHEGDTYGDDLGGGVGGGWGGFEAGAYAGYYYDDDMTTSASPLGPRGTARRAPSKKAAASRAGQRPTSSAKARSVPKNARTSGGRRATNGSSTRTAGTRSTGTRSAGTRSAGTRTAGATTARKTSTARKPAKASTSAARKPAARSRTTGTKTVRATITTRGTTRRR